MHKTSFGLLLAAPVAALGLLAGACGPDGGDDGDGAGACGALVAGDLVISEIMANPDGEDTGKEWFEIYNPGDTPVDLRGVTLTASRTDGTSAKSHEADTLTIPARGYVVVGGVLPAVRPAHVNYGYGSDLGSLLNSAGKLSLRCGSTLLDEVIYEEMSDGVARGFTGSQAPDALANDTLAMWCDAETEYEAGSKGSPGDANAPCGGVAPGMCDDGGTMRPTVPPVEGDLIITEIMPSPATADDTSEWFEIYVNADVDLNGLELGKTLGDPDTVLTQTACARYTAGTYLIVGRNGDMAMNGGLPRVDVLFDFALTGGPSALVVSLGGSLLDQVTWTSAPNNASLQLDPDAQTVTGNDDQAAFCRGTTMYGAGGAGTPGAENAQCPPAAGMCDDGGVVRPIVKPTAGQLVITEVLANTKGAEDANKEWFEVLATGSFDLNGLQIGQVPPTVRLTLSSPTCLAVTNGQYLLFAGSEDALANAGLPMVDFVKNFALTASGASAGLFVGIDGTVIDAITWTQAPEATSRQLSIDTLDATANDLEANFCDGTSMYGTEMYLGTPKTANLDCTP